MPEEAGLNLNLGGSPYHLSAEITDYGVNGGCCLDGVERAPHTGEQMLKNIAEDMLSPRIIHQHPQFLANVSIQSGCIKFGKHMLLEVAMNMCVF